jgi:hypothetical protein
VLKYQKDQFIQDNQRISIDYIALKQTSVMERYGATMASGKIKIILF